MQRGRAKVTSVTAVKPLILSGLGNSVDEDSYETNQ